MRHCVYLFLYNISNNLLLYFYVSPDPQLISDNKSLTTGNLSTAVTHAFPR